jgi:hypothetical protein
MRIPKEVTFWTLNHSWTRYSGQCFRLDCWAHLQQENSQEASLLSIKQRINENLEKASTFPFEPTFNIGQISYPKEASYSKRLSNFSLVFSHRMLLCCGRIDTWINTDQLRVDYRNKQTNKRFVIKQTIAVYIVCNLKDIMMMSRRLQ